MDNIYVYYFKSYSGDEYFMKSHEKKYDKSDAEEFCKDNIEYEYEAWGNSKFKYSKFEVFETLEDEFVKLPRSFGEWYKVVPNDIEEFDYAYFTDEYQPKTYSSDGRCLN